MVKLALPAPPVKLLLRSVRLLSDQKGPVVSLELLTHRMD
jgi:hypothetical protein